MPTKHSVLQPEVGASESISGSSWGFSAQAPPPHDKGTAAAAADGGGGSGWEAPDSETRSEMLYIQMEFCPRTLKVWKDSRRSLNEVECRMPPSQFCRGTECWVWKIRVRI